MRSWTLAGAVLASALIASGAAAQSAPDPVESALRATDEIQRQAIAEADVSTLRRIFHSALLVNAPSYRVLSRDQVLGMVGSGDIAAERFERTIEMVQITGDLGVVMGRETIVPTEASEAGRMFGAKPLVRRYSNIYVREDGEWRMIARHANVVPQP